MNAYWNADWTNNRNVKHQRLMFLRRWVSDISGIAVANSTLFAKHPVLKLQAFGFDVDLSMNSHDVLPAVNFALSQQDIYPSLKSLMLVTKRIFKCRSLMDTHLRGMSSHNLLCLHVAFFMVGIERSYTLIPLS